MPSRVDDRDLATWRECRDCGLLQRLPEIPDGEAAECVRCGATLRRAARDSINFARVSGVVCASLFVLALGLPFIELRVLGRFSTSTLFTGPSMLRERGLPGLAIVVLLTLVLMPAVKIAVELTVLFGVRAEHPPRWLPWVFGWLERIAPWSMVEVFLLGSFVAYTRLRALADVAVGPAIFALGGVMLSMVATDGTLDREAIWEDLEAKGTRLDRATPHTARPRASSPSLRILGCHTCGRVVHAEEREACPRCGHHLFFRKAGGNLGGVWAMLLTAALLYIPANILPVMTVQRFGRGAPSTILGGVVELAEAHMWPLALLVLLASVVVPMVKLVSMAVMLVMTQRGSAAGLKGRTRMFRFVHAIGRWSMIDIFMLATLVGVVRLGFISTILPGLGAGAFCAVVIVTMLATEMFDPRWMWDAAGLPGEAQREREAVER
jgi:paraquat-inducible protein A